MQVELQGTPFLQRGLHKPATLLLLTLVLKLLDSTTALAIDKTDGGSSTLQIEQPSQPLLDHTQTHFLPNRTGIVELFEWKFADIAAECEQFLGPYGYAGVQISPVAEHLVVSSDTIVQHPWWERYQPLSLKIASRSGDEAEFQQMTQICNAAGVRVYVDVVLNHMAGAYDEETASGQRLLVGFAGSTANASSFDFPTIGFVRRHFHKPCDLSDYMDAHVVRNCALNGWPDLDHYRLDVRANLTDFLNRLVDLGAAGFRVDAAKYIWPIDIKLLFKGVTNLNSEDFDFPENARPFVYQDVVDLGVDAISKTEYSSYGMVTDYLYAAELASIISGKVPLSSLINWGPAMGFLPHQQALVFVDSHDAQRDRRLLGANQLLSYRQPRKYIMATAFMLAHPYGRVKRIMSSYYFAAQQPEQGPPMKVEEEEDEKAETEVEADDEVGDGEVAEGDEEPAEANGGGEEPTEGDEGPAAADDDADVDTTAVPSPQIRSPTFDVSTGRCEFASGWVCEHRWPPIVQMIRLVNTLSELEDGVINFQTDGPNHIAFCRGNKAFFVFNNDARLAYDAQVETCLQSGVYCDVISGGRAENGESTTDCVGKRVVVDVEGKAHILLPAVFGGEGDEAVVGSDYDETDVEANDAYGVAVGVEGEFGVLAIYDGSRLEGDAEKPPTVVEDEEDAEDAEDATGLTEEENVTKEDVSPEELEDAAVETKSAKLEEAATDASVENENAEGQEEKEEGKEEEEEEEEKKEEEEEEVKPADEEETGEAAGDDMETVAAVEGGAATEAEGENEAKEEGEPVVEEQPVEEESSVAQANEVSADEPTESPDQPLNDQPVGAEGPVVVKVDEGTPDEHKAQPTLVMHDIQQAISDVAKNVDGYNEFILRTGVNDGVSGVVEEANEVIAKAGFGNNKKSGVSRSQSLGLCTLPILIIAILINF